MNEQEEKMLFVAKEMASWLDSFRGRLKELFAQVSEPMTRKERAESFHEDTVVLVEDLLFTPAFGHPRERSPRIQSFCGLQLESLELVLNAYLARI